MLFLIALTGFLTEPHIQTRINGYRPVDEPGMGIFIAYRDTR